MEIQLAQVLFQIINFGVVFGALTYFLTGPILKFIDERRKKTEETALAQETIAKEKEQIEAAKKKARQQAEKDAQGILEAARADAKDLFKKLSKEVKEEIAAMRESEIAKLQKQMKNTAKDMEKEVLSLSVSIASKVLGEEIDAKKHGKLVESAVASLIKSL